MLVDAANYVEVGRDVWRSVVDETQCPVCVIEVVCRDEDVHRQRLQMPGASGRPLILRTRSTHRR